MPLVADYVKTDWVDNVTLVDEARMDHIEAGIDAVTDAVNAVEARLAPTPVVNGQWIKGSGGAMVWSAIAVSDVTGLQAALDAKEATVNKGAANGYAPLDSGSLVPLVNLPPIDAGSSIEYENDWAAGTAYTAGDVARYNGIDYLAVNPSTGQTPGASTIAGIGTSLPASPSDGAEYTLVDSLTAPTYSWKFRYVAAKASNKWVFIGGAAASSYVATGEGVVGTTYAALATAGPSFTVPVAGDYLVRQSARFNPPAGNAVFMSYDIGGTAASDLDALVGQTSTVIQNGGTRETRRQALAVSTALVSKYRATAAGPVISERR